MLDKLENWTETNEMQIALNNLVKIVPGIFDLFSVIESIKLCH